MLINMRFSTIKLCVVCFLAAVLLQFSWVRATQASALRPMAQRAADCQVKMLAGWRPYRVQAGDSLDVLALRANVASDVIIQVNCLTGAVIDTDDLLLLPTLAQEQPGVSGTAQNQRVAESPVPGEAVSAVQPLITVISTTTTLSETEAAATATPISGSVMELPPVSPASPFTAANIIAFSLFALGALGVFYFALRPRSEDSATTRTLFGLLGNVVFLFTGILVGVILFPLASVPSFTTLPTGVSAGLAVALIGLLVVKELFFSGQQWRTMSRLLNFGIVPLLMLFFLTVATRMAEIIH